MPKPTPKPQDDSYSEQEMHDWLKSRGYNLDIGAKPGDPAAPANAVPPATSATTSAAPAASPGLLAPLGETAAMVHRAVAGEGAPGRTPTYAEMDWQQRAGQGAAREMARLGIGAGRLAGQFLPTTVRRTLGDLAGQVPGVKRMEDFAAAPAEGPMEYLGQGAADIATAGLTPSLRLGDLAAKAVTRTAPVWVNPLGAGGRWMAGAANPGTRAAARLAGNIAERAGTGAVGGAIMDPEDPLTGAEYGAGGSVGAAALGRAMQSQFGQNLGGTLMRYLPASAAYALLHHLGVGELGAVGGGALAHGVAHGIRGYHSPMGRALHGVGTAAAERTGTAIERNLPAGIEAGKAAAESYTPQDASDWWERTQRPTVTVPRRPSYIEEENAQTGAQ